MTDQHDSTARPDWACLLCPPPRREGHWRRADDGYRSCSPCLDRLRETLRDIGACWRKLDPTPGAYAEHGTRGAPGFASRPPASLHVIAMRDRRSKSGPVSRDGVDYVWDPYSLDGHRPLPPGVHGPNTAGNYTTKRDVWHGADGRLHTEAEQPTRSVAEVLHGWAGLVADERDMTTPGPDDVAELVRWLDGQLDWVTRQDWVADVADGLRELDADLKPVTGEPTRRSIGKCPNTIDEGAQTRRCDARLFAPTNGSDTIRCTQCSREWPRSEWERLGQLLQSGQAA